jgi:hypothetical protein
MREKDLRCALIIISVMIFFLMTVIHFFHINNQSKSWTGNYSYEEFAPPNQFRHYTITIYEDNGLYARIKLDGFQILERMTAKVWTHNDEIWLTFYEYYVDEEGITSELDKYEEGNTLLEMRREGDVLITTWYAIQSILIKNQEPGQYFTKDEE